MPQEADHFAADTAKGVQAQLAAGIVRKPTKDPLRDLQGFVTLDEESFPIDRFRHSRTMALQQESRQGWKTNHGDLKVPIPSGFSANPYAAVSGQTEVDSIPQASGAPRWHDNYR